MKVGDLVTLSAYGRKRRRAEWITSGDVGVISKVRSWSNGVGVKFCDYIVHWRMSQDSFRKGRYSWDHDRYNQRKDLKYVK